MNASTESASWRDWCQLIRLPNVFTVVADTSAAFVLVAHELEPIVRYVSIIAAVCCLYWAGMILNDVWDVEIDRAERPSRPLPSNRIGLSAAKRVGWTLMFFGIVLALATGYFAPGAASSLLPGTLAIGLAIMIIAYDGLLKQTWASPVAMGMCRFLSFLLGGSVALSPQSFPFFAPYVIAIAAGFGVYIIGVTIMARGEAVGGNRQPLMLGLVVSVIGLALIAGAPRFATDGVQFYLDPARGFPLLVGLLSFTIIHRASKAIADPEPTIIQMNIRHAILTLIPLSAAVALLGCGPIIGMAIFSLVIPAMFLGSFLRIT